MPDILPESFKLCTMKPSYKKRKEKKKNLESSTHGLQAMHHQKTTLRYSPCILLIFPNVFWSCSVLLMCVMSTRPTQKFCIPLSLSCCNNPRMFFTSLKANNGPRSGSEKWISEETKQPSAVLTCSLITAALCYPLVWPKKTPIHHQVDKGELMDLSVQRSTWVLDCCFKSVIFSTNLWLKKKKKRNSLIKEATRGPAMNKTMMMIGHWNYIISALPVATDPFYCLHRALDENPFF